MPSLSGLSLADLQALVEEGGWPRFTARQVMSWLYQKQIFSIQEMTNLSQKVRQELERRYTLGRTSPSHVVTSKDGTEKYLFPTDDGYHVETVYIPTADRATLCVSSQVGCKMGCRFCMTGRQGFSRHLTVAEILNQIYSSPHFPELTNIVFMGQGEPFDNTDNLLQAIHILTQPEGLAWSPRRITVSTVGLVKGMHRFLEESDCHLALSLHFPTPSLRREWMPVEKAYPVVETIRQLRRYDFSHQRRLSFEYILFRGVNDGIAHADSLLALLKGLSCRVNLIPFHAIPDSPLQGCTDRQMMQFRDYLTRHGLMTTLRASRGQDIEAACGLLASH